MTLNEFLKKPIDVCLSVEHAALIPNDIFRFCDETLIVVGGKTHKVIAVDVFNNCLWLDSSVDPSLVGSPIFLAHGKGIQQPVRLLELNDVSLDGIQYA